MYLLKIFVICSLFLFPFGELLRFYIGNNIALKLLDIFVGLSALTWVIVFRKKVFKYIHWHYLLFPFICLFTLLINISWLTPNEIVASSLYFIRWVMYASYFVIFSTFLPMFKKKLLLFLFIDGLVLLVFGYLQYFFYNSLKNLYYLGWDDHMHRMFSTFLDPNFTGGFLVLYFLFLIGAMHYYFQKKKKKKVLFLAFILFFTLIGIFLTFSRAALVMLVFGSCTFFILTKRKKFVIALLTVLLLFGVIISPKFYDENMNLFRMNSSKARLENYSVALKIIGDRPLFGVGFNTYRYAKLSYGENENWVNAPSHADAGVDNSFLFVAATTGVIGLSTYLFLWFLFAKRAYFLHKKKKNILSVIVISSIVGLFVNALFINSLFFAPFMLWMWMLLGSMEDFS